MKVAIVFTGLLRNFEQAHPAFKQYFLDRYDCDVYFDIWSEVGYYTGKAYQQSPSDHFVKLAEGDRGFHESGEQVNVQRIMELYNPISLRIENFDSFEPIADEAAKLFPNAFTRPKNTICQAYKIMQGMRTVVGQASKYDLVVRARPDIVLEHDPGLFEPGVFYTLPSKNKHGQGTGDSIQIGHIRDMFGFSDMYLDLKNLYDEIGYSCPHKFVEHYIKKLRLNWKELHIGARVAHSPSGIPYAEPT
jgi:hypothetical protein